MRPSQFLMSCTRSQIGESAPRPGPEPRSTRDALGVVVDVVPTAQEYVLWKPYSNPALRRSELSGGCENSKAPSSV